MQSTLEYIPACGTPLRRAVTLNQDQTKMCKSCPIPSPIFPAHCACSSQASSVIDKLQGFVGGPTGFETAAAYL
ncbi:hypothetical protein IF2G_06709 [Cordyceps javanica]|nr:hypothetical protein IF2G_06709 [Cordyceps javanica]